MPNPKKEGFVVQVNNNATNHALQQRYGASISGNVLTVYATPTSNSTQVTREKITEFSKSSKSNLTKYCREINKDRFYSFITLTYRHAPSSPAESKNHLHNFIRELKRIKRYSKKELSGLWIMEFQDRGAIHYHIWFSHFVKHQWIQATWNRVSQQDAKTPSTDIKKWNQYTSKGLSSYAAKYANKQAQKELPDGIKHSGRWWGKFGDVSTPLAAKIKLDFEGFDIFLKMAQKTFKQIPCDYCGLFILTDQQASEMLKIMQSESAIPIPI